jgi:RNA-directed DNA polymerase
MSHEWTMKFIEHRVADRRILRLIQKWLKAGVSEDGQWLETNVGTPQGAVVSPLIANVYLHYTFDLWADVWRRKVAKGNVIRKPAFRKSGSWLRPGRDPRAAK